MFKWCLSIENFAPKVSKGRKIFPCHDAIMTTFPLQSKHSFWYQEPARTLALPPYGRTWWQMETFSALLALCEGNPPVTGGFPSQRPATQSFDIFFDLRLNKGFANDRDAGDLRRHRAHYDVTVLVHNHLLHGVVPDISHWVIWAIGCNLSQNHIVIDSISARSIKFVYGALLAVCGLHPSTFQKWAPFVTPFHQHPWTHSNAFCKTLIFNNIFKTIRVAYNEYILL